MKKKRKNDQLPPFHFFRFVMWCTLWVIAWWLLRAAIHRIESPDIGNSNRDQPTYLTLLILYCWALWIGWKPVYQLGMWVLRATSDWYSIFQLISLSFAYMVCILIILGASFWYWFISIFAFIEPSF